jgi:hypothetical protein
MIVVTGTRRSGTSMWMQVLAASGIPVIGDAFPFGWERTIAEANPRGFFESRWRRGVWWATNPDPATGAWVSADQVRGHAVKMFARGLARTERAYIERVIVCVRDWREYGPSLARLEALERAGRTAGAGRASRRRLPAALEWWTELMLVLRDVAQRGLDARLVAYDAAVSAPTDVVAPVLRWLGAPDVDAGVLAVEGALRTVRASEVDHCADAAWQPTAEQCGAFDALVACARWERPLDGATIALFNQVDAELSVQAASLRRTEARRRRAARAGEHGR